VRSRLVLCKQETKHAAPSSKSKDWNQDNVFEWRDMSSRGLNEEREWVIVVYR
jgi:hypothetical protein